MKRSKVVAAMDAAERTEAAANLGGLLRQGGLTLLLGAGVSRGVGLPDWDELIERCEAAVDVTSVKNSNFMHRMDTVRRKAGNADAYKAIVHRALYRDVPTVETYPDEILGRRMLIALGALVMSSSRGSVSDVLTLNFDDVLDWYLHLHGFSTQVVTNLPTLVTTVADVRIMHIHGFLPLNAKFEASDSIVLTHSELVTRLSDVSAPWPIHIASLLQSKVLLAVGTSMNDTDIDVLLQRASERIGGRRPVGYVISANMDSDRRAALAEWGVRSVSLDSHDEVPEFILEVCRRAANP